MSISITNNGSSPIRVTVAPATIGVLEADAGKEVVKTEVAPGASLDVDLVGVESVSVHELTLPAGGESVVALPDGVPPV